MDPLFGRLALLTSYGLTLLEALDLAAEEAGSRATAVALRNIKSRIEQGAPLSGSLDGIALFRPHRALIALGENLGALDTAFAEIAQGSDLRIDFLNWLSVDLQYKPFAEAFAECAAILPPAERRARPATLAEAARRLPGLFPPPLGALLARDLPAEEQRNLLMRAAEGRRSGVLPASAKTLRDGLLRTFTGMGLAIRSGIPLLAALEDLAASLPAGKLASALRRSIAMVVEGKMLTEALDAHPALFTASIRRMVRRAEEGGNLEKACDLIARGLQAGVL